MFMMRPLMLGNGLLSALRPQDVFATSLHTGTGATQRITNGLDLLGQGGMVWDKNRSTASTRHFLTDTVRGGQKYLSSNLTDAETNSANTTPQFFNDGFQATAYAGGSNAVAWSFRRASKFFDIVPYTGDGVPGRKILHALSITAGAVIIKRLDVTSDWTVAHRSLTNDIYLNTTAAMSANGQVGVGDATGFLVGSGAGVNQNNGRYVALVFAHDPDTTNGIVQCGSTTTNTTGAASVTLDYPLQWILIRASDLTRNWLILDTARGVTNALNPNLSNAEGNGGNGFSATQTGFSVSGFDANSKYIYCAIRAPIN